MSSVSNAARSRGVRKEIIRAEPFDVLLNAGQRFLGHRGVGVDRRLKCAKPGRRVAGGLDGIEKANAVSRHTEIRPDRNRSTLPRPCQRSVGRPRVPKVIAHETFDPLTGLGAGISQQVGCSFLHLMAEDVLIPSCIQVQRRTHAQQEILRLIDPCRIGRPSPQQQSDRSASRSCAPPSDREAHRALL